MGFVLFYGNKEIYSNFYPAAFEIEGKVFPTSEHYFMYAKAMKFDPNGPVTYETLVSSTPAEAKKQGRQVRFFSESSWSAVDQQIMYEACLAKFSQNSELKKQILETGDNTIVECSPRDRKWGIGMGKNNPDAQNPDKWRGRNLLGETLMRVRAQLREELSEQETAELNAVLAKLTEQNTTPQENESSNTVDSTELETPLIPLPNVSVGDKVIHRAFKEGVVSDISERRIKVNFVIGEKVFVFPNAIHDGFLKISEEEAK